MNRPPRHLLASVGLLLLPVILLWPCLFGPRAFVPWDIAQFAPARTTMTDAEFARVTQNNNTDVTEIPVMFVPELRFIQSELARGEFPHWNPYSRSGTTVWSSSILGLWYPLNWLMLVADDPVDALAIGAFCSLAIAMLLAYGFLVHLGLSVPAALFGALAFGLSGTLTVNLHFYQRINALIWLPGILWAAGVIRDRAGRARIPPVLGLAFCMFMCHTAGFPPYTLVVTLVAMAYCLRLLLQHADRGLRPTLGLAGALAGGAALGMAIAAIQSIPMAEFFPESNRTMQAAGNSIASGGFDPAGLLGYLCPTVFTHPHVNHTGGLRDLSSPLFWYLYSRSSWLPAAGIPAGTVFQPNLNFCEYTVFVGTPTLLLAAIGLLTRGAALRWFAGGALLLLYLLATAPAALQPVLEAAPFRWVPPSRYTGVTCLFVALLAAGGIHALPRLSERLRRGVWIAGAVLGSGLLVAWYVFAHHYTAESFLQALTPGLQAKYAARYASESPAALAAHIQDYMGQDAPMALRKLIANLLTAGVFLLASAAVLCALPLLRRHRHGIGLAQIGLLAIAAVELLRFGIPLNTGRELHPRPLNDTPVHDFLRAQRDRHAATGGFSVLRAHDPARHSVVTLPSQLPPDTLLQEQIRDQQAYTFVDKRSHLPILQLYGPEQLARDTWPMSIRDDELLQHRFWDMVGVRFVLSEDRLRHAGKPVGPVLSGPPDLPPDRRTRHFYIYERPRPLPRAWVVHDFRAVQPQADRQVPSNMADTPEVRHNLDLAAAVADRNFDPEQVALLDPDTAAALGPAAHRSATPGNTRPVRFPIPNQTNSLTLQVAPGEAGYLVVGDTMLRGWTVTVDGAPATIHRVNLFQRMVVIPTSTAAVRVEFSYTTPGFTAGALVSGAAGLAWLALLAWFLASRRTGPRVEVPS